MDTQTATFTVEVVKRPEGTKPGQIKTEAGKWLTVWPGQIDQFREGGKYRAVLYNKPFNNKDNWTVSAPDKGGKIEVLGTSDKANGNGAGHTSETSGGVSEYESNKQEGIYVCGVV